ncbi:MAG: hypothetical protein KUG80_04925 [Gammaproteobacteria bacterium]|nr:hypothetical protein [Gammaproteobacteria bacterium]
MRSWPSKIGIFDSNETDVELFDCMLTGQMSTCFAASMEEARGIMSDEYPEVYIIAYEWLCEHGGVDLIKEIKSPASGSETPYVIFFSDCNAEARLEYFEAGVDEFLSKPFDLLDLESRLNTLSDVAHRLNSTKHLLENAKQTAFDAMEASSELGIVMRYSDTINGIDSFAGLGSALLSATHSMGVRCSYQFHTDSKVYTDGNPLGSHDERILTELRQRGSIVDFGKRSLFNQAHMSLLVKNMPDKSTMKFGRLKDNLQVICNVTENKIFLLNAELKRAEQKLLSTDNAIKSSSEQLNNVTVEFKQLEKGIDDVMLWLKTEMEHKLISLDLNEEQEIALLAMVDSTIEMLSISRNAGGVIDSHLNSTKSILSSLLH